ncbi:hypothetical protein V5799_018600 [Amblyomma americanum]|uniref:Uncharacterized protein n=1 Tax=Amblyomma americanum TaxID=6943 RepID=A0AAQ4EZ27_AMBAM
MSPASWRNASLPLEADGRLSRCNVYKKPGDPNDTRIVSCDKWDYDPEQERSTIISYWDLVCHRQWLRALAEAFYIGGSLIAMSAVGLVADRVGRMPVLLSAVAVLQIATVGGCCAASYQAYVLSRFLNSGCVATVAVLSCTLLFEASTHEKRNRHLCAAMTAGMLMVEVWLAMARLLRQVNWIVMQIFILSPTVLTLYAVSAVHESARWCISVNDMDRAEVLMIAAAKENHFPVSTTACMLERLRTEVLRTERRITITSGDAAEAKAVQRSALVMLGLSFSSTFTQYSMLAVQAYVASGTTAWFQWTSSGANLASFILLYVLFTKISPPRLLAATVAAVCGITCVISLSFAFGYGYLTTLSFLLAKPLTYVVKVLIFTNVLEMVPTRVRCGTICWLFGFGRVGGVCAILLSVQRDIGRNDVLFALAGTALFMMLLAQLTFLHSSEQQTLGSHLSSAGAMDTMDYMKKTLDSLPSKKEYNRKSRGSARSSRFQCMDPRFADIRLY